MTPLVSVCVPVYNGGELLTQALESVLSQTFTDFEVVVADNCSTDDTLERVRKYDDPRIRLLVSDRNAGSAANWNRVRAEARGEFVKLMAADDLLYPTCLEAQVSEMDDSSVVLVAGRRDVVDEAGRVLIRARGLPRMSGPYQGMQVVRNMVRAGSNLIGEPPFALIRREPLLQCAPFGTHRPYLVDVELWCQLLQLGDLFAMPVTVGAFRVRLLSESVGTARTQGTQARELYADLRREFPDVISSRDAFVGSARAAGVARLRRSLYRWMRFRARFAR